MALSAMVFAIGAQNNCDNDNKGQGRVKATCQRKGHAQQSNQATGT